MMHALHRGALPLSASLLTLLIPVSAAAHHFMDEAVPRSAAEALLSGAGHPVVGADHLLFLALVGFLIAGMWTGSVSWRFHLLSEQLFLAPHCSLQDSSSGPVKGWSRRRLLSVGCWFSVARVRASVRSRYCWCRRDSSTVTLSARCLSRRRSTICFLTISGSPSLRPQWSG